MDKWITGNDVKTRKHRFEWRAGDDDGIFRYRRFDTSCTPITRDGAIQQLHGVLVGKFGRFSRLLNRRTSLTVQYSCMPQYSEMVTPPYSSHDAIFATANYYARIDGVPRLEREVAGRISRSWGGR